MSQPIPVPPMALASLRGLFAAKQHADQIYTVALNSTIAALGLDPRQQHSFDIDAGILTPAVVKEGE